MSRLAKKPIEYAKNVDVSFDSTNFSVKGPQGELSLVIRPVIDVKINNEDRTIVVAPKNNQLETRALVGTYASRIKSMISGVVNPFVRTLIIEGVGYRAEAQGTKLNMALGFSHPVVVDVPAGIKVTVEKGVITITGIDKVSVGQFAAQVRAFKKPEPYKGKGIRYSDEVIRRKQGKKSV